MTDTASITRPSARASHDGADALLAWMVARAPGPFSARSIGDSGPRAVRRRPDLDAAIAVLVERGLVEEASSKPRVLRLTDGDSVVIECAPVSLLPGPDAVLAKHSELLAERQDLPEQAASYITSTDLQRWLLKQMGLTYPELERLGEMADDIAMQAFGCAAATEGQPTSQQPQSPSERI